MRKLSVCLGLALIITLCASPAFAQGGNMAKGLLDSFVGQTDNWWGILRGYALFLFSTTLILEVCLFGIRMALQRSDISETLGQFVTLLLFAGFIAAVIMNYQEWATGIAVKGLQPLTGQLTGNSVDAGKPLAIASILVQKIMLVLKNAGVSDIGMVMLYELVLVLIIIVFVLISALIIVTTCEFYIVANIGVLLIGLGGSKIFKDYAVNVMRYVLAVAIKLFVLQLIVNIGMALISLADIGTASGAGDISTVKFVDLFYIIGKGFILLALAKTLPETCAGIVNGSAIGGGNPLVSVGKAAGTMALSAASVGAGYAVGAASALNNAHTLAKGEGATGITGTAGGMARAMWNARGDAKAGHAQKELDQNPGSIRNQLRSAANAVKAKKALEEQEKKEAEKAAAASRQAAPAFEAADGYEKAESVGAASSPAMAADGYHQAALSPDVSAADGYGQGESSGTANSESQSGPVPPDTPSGGGGSGLPAPHINGDGGEAVSRASQAAGSALPPIAAADGFGQIASSLAANGDSQSGPTPPDTPSGGGSGLATSQTIIGGADAIGTSGTGLPGKAAADGFKTAPAVPLAADGYGSAAEQRGQAVNHISSPSRNKRRKGRSRGRR